MDELTALQLENLKLKNALLIIRNHTWETIRGETMVTTDRGEDVYIEDFVDAVLQEAKP